MKERAGAEIHDVVIAGGGFVGVTLSLALARSGARVALADASADASASTAERPIALAYGSRRILESLGLWDGIGASAAPIRAVHVSDRGRFGVTRLRASDCGVDALGYVSDAARIGAVLNRALSEAPEISVLRPFAVDALRPGAESIRVEADPAAGNGTPRALDARLVAAADGGQSAVRRLSGIAARRHDWGQSAVTATVVPRFDQGGVAYERFTARGPVALLPAGRRRCGLVWTVPHEDADALMGLGDAAFLDALGDTFGTRLGAFLETGPRTCHRLHSSHSAAATAARVALTGNAANHLHPVAGQGLNLGLRDAAMLAEVVVEAIRAGTDPGAPEVLQRYAGWRRRDQAVTSAFTAGLVRLFSNDLTPVALLRGAGLIGVDSFNLFKRPLARHAMGLGGRSSRLARGIPL